jgi:hypothetical protein
MLVVSSMMFLLSPIFRLTSLQKGLYENPYNESNNRLKPMDAFRQQEHP